jgi:hypothetical protein
MHAHQAARQRVAQLEAAATVDGVLDAEQETELMVLQARVQRLEGHISRLRDAVGKEQVGIDVEAVVAAWAPLVEQKMVSYQEFQHAIGQLRSCFLHIVSTHVQQERLIEKLPRELQARLVFVDPATQKSRIAGSMPVPQAWQMLLCSPDPLPLPSMAALTENDAGLKALPPRILEQFSTQDTQGA